MWFKFLWNIRRKVDVLSIIIFKETFLRACGSLISGAAPTPINSKINHVANQLIFRITRVQKLSILFLKFKAFLKTIFKQGLAHFLKTRDHTCIIQSRNTAVSSLRGSRGPCPPNECLCPPISVYFVFFLEHTQDFLGPRQLRNQREGAKEPSAPFSQDL